MSTKNKTNKPKIDKELELRDCLNDVYDSLDYLITSIEEGEMSPNRIIERIQYINRDIDRALDFTNDND